MKLVNKKLFDRTTNRAIALARAQARAIQKARFVPIGSPVP